MTQLHSLRSWKRRAGQVAGLAAFLALPLSGAVKLELVGTYESGIWDEGAAEIGAYHAPSQQLYVTNADAGTVDVLDISDPANPVLAFTIDPANSINSVAIYGDTLAIAMEGDEDWDNGTVEFYDYEGNFLGNATVGNLPDMVTFTPDGTKVLVANEGEPVNATLDPEGSIAIVDVSGGFASPSVTIADFNAFDNATLDDSVRIFGNGDGPTTVSQDLEPEYIAISDDGSTAYVTLQENNALAIVDIANGTVSAILGLGFKDWSTAGVLDVSDRDDAINLQNWPIFGMYQPDAIASYTVGGQTYLVTANEGDARGFEEDRVKDLTLNATVFTNASIQDDDQLGRLEVTNTLGHGGDEDFEAIYAYGARSITVWDGTTGALLWDSGSIIEEKVAELLPDDFNSDNDENDSFDSRSDAKGPEPEGVVVGQIGGHFYAFVGLERVGGVMVFDVTNPMAPVYVSYLNNRDFSIDLGVDEIDDGTPDNLSAAGDLGPEGLVFIPAADSPNGMDMLAVTNEVSGTTSLYNVTEVPWNLTVLHNNDGESALFDDDGYGGIAQFVSKVSELRMAAETDGNATITLSSGDNFLAGPRFDASLSTRGENTTIYYDALGLNAINYDAIIIGNHDFDFGPSILAEFIEQVDSTVPYLSANLDFSTESSFDTLLANERVGSSAIIEVPFTNTAEGVSGMKRIGVIGATTPNLPFISSPGNITVSSQLASIVQDEIDYLREVMMVDAVIFVSHLQGVEEDADLIEELEGVDIAIAGGGDDLLANVDAILAPGDSSEGPYPTLISDVDGNDIPLVTTSGNYRYVGQLFVEFDANNTLLSATGNPELVVDVAINGTVGVTADAEVQTAVVDPVEAHVEGLAANVIADNDVPLDGRRNSVRGFETSLGNLIADSMLWAGQVFAEENGAAVADIALVGGGGIRNNDIINEEGLADADFTELDTFDILPFTNFVSVVEGINYKQLKDQLEIVVGRTAPRDGVPTPSGGGTGRFAQIAGFSMFYDISNQAVILDGEGNVLIDGNRVLDVVLDDGTVVVSDGVVAESNATLNIAMTSFHAAQGDQWLTFLSEVNYVNLPITYQQALSQYIQAPRSEGGLNRDIFAAEYGPATVGERIVELEQSLIWEYISESFSGYRFSQYYGPLYDVLYPWVYSPTLGWVYTQVMGDDNWLYTENDGLLYRTPAYQMWVWSATTGDFYAYIGDVESGLNWWNGSTGEFVGQIQ